MKFIFQKISEIQKMNVSLQPLWEKSFIQLIINNSQLIIETKNKIAKVAQLAEHDLAKVGVAGSSPVFRSNKYSARMVEW